MKGVFFFSWCLVLLVSCQEQSRKSEPAASASRPPAQASAAPAPAPTPSSAAKAQAPVSPEQEAICASMCERGKALHCPVDAVTCRAACRESLAPPCDAELSAALSCMAREPLNHWECSDEGLPVIRAGYCDAPQGKAVECMQRAVRSL
jgi:hypothetical protein